MAGLQEVECNDLSIQQAGGKTIVTDASAHIKCTLTIEHDKQLDRHLARLKTKNKKHNFRSFYPAFMCPTLLPTVRRWHWYICQLCDLLRVRLSLKNMRMSLYDAEGLRIGEDVAILGYDTKSSTGFEFEMADIEKHLKDDRIAKIDFFCSMFANRPPMDEDDLFELPPHLQMYLPVDPDTGLVNHADLSPTTVEPHTHAAGFESTQDQRENDEDNSTQEAADNDKEEATPRTPVSEDSDLSTLPPEGSPTSGTSDDAKSAEGAASGRLPDPVLGYASSLPIGWTTGMADLGPEIQAYRDRVAVTPIGQSTGIDPASLVDYWLYDTSEKWDPERAKAIGESLLPKSKRSEKK